MLGVTESPSAQCKTIMRDLFKREVEDVTFYQEGDHDDLGQHKLEPWLFAITGLLLFAAIMLLASYFNWQLS